MTDGIVKKRIDDVVEIFQIFHILPYGFSSDQFYRSVLPQGPFLRGVYEPFSIDIENLFIRML